AAPAAGHGAAEPALAAAGTALLAGAGLEPAPRHAAGAELIPPACAAAAGASARASRRRIAGASDAANVAVMCWASRKTIIPSRSASQYPAGQTRSLKSSVAALAKRPLASCSQR